MLNNLLSSIEQSEKESDRQFITSLARGLSVLYSQRFYPNGMSHQQIVDITQLPKATVSRVLHTLIKLRFLRKHPSTGLYVTDIRFREMAQIALDSNQLVRDARPLMMAFAEKYEVSVSLAVEDGGEMLYLESIRSPARLAVQLTVGSTVPLIDTAIGRAYYSALDDTQRKLLEDHGLKAHLAENQEVRKRILREQMDFFTEHGYCYSVGEFSHDITAVAVVVRSDGVTNGVYALNASVPSSRVSLEELIAKVVEPLKALAKDLEQLS
ncbi:Solvent efflux pump srpABC operon corepressor [Oligella ureolytica]|uniref:IclR family transcriptional regulator n=1 Tax=Oligella ureolytica TaxID=90244 RepID=A0A378XGV5_9BURK|nr:IclR family transcriptional regulator [Oligella ureolytica]QPT41182.1 IclR family transcriptional regulator [Oligella ureolytica]SUA53988.1 Solvent efflux pump srpABC operon corepressor [Oligella ureolytica]